MFKLNLKIAFRNLIKYKNFTVFNILGLSFGLTASMLILLYINKENSFDKWDPALQQTYIVAADYTQNGAPFKGTKIKGIFKKVIDEKIPEIEVSSIGSLNQRNLNLRTNIADIASAQKINAVFMDSSFTKVYPIKAFNGNIDEIYHHKNAIAISKSAAERLFGKADPLNKTLIYNLGPNAPEQQLTVKAVWDDKKYSSYFGFDVLYPTNTLETFGSQYINYTFSTLFKIKANLDQEQVLQKINDTYIIELAKFYSKNSDAQFNPKLAEAKRILSDKEGITSIKLITSTISNLNLSDFYNKTSKQTTIYILVSLAAFLIIISCINYTNLTLVLSQNRAKEVGVKKVLGTSRRMLIKQYFLETAIQCVTAFLIALMLTELLLPQINQIINGQLVFLTSTRFWVIISQICLIILVIIFLSGIYPAFVLANYSPVKVLKGNFNTAVHVGSLRKVLIVAQFTIAIALVISFMVINTQLKFMQNKDLGLHPAQLMSLNINSINNRNLNPERFTTIKNRLLAIEGVEDVTRATEQPINDSGWSDDIKFENTLINVESRYVDPNYFSVLKGKILKGRDFSPELLATDSVESIILNETAFNALNMRAVNESVGLVDDEKNSNKFNVVGVVKDIQAYGFETKILPTVYFVRDYAFHWRRNIIIRINTADVGKTVTAIRTLWKEIDPGQEPVYSFVDETFRSMNKSYEVNRNIIFLFGMITFLVSLIGLISISAYSIKIKTKEIAIRKILGANIVSLIKNLNTDFVKLVLVANVIADVLAFIYMGRWFKNFAYHIDMPVLIFLWVNAAILLITVVTVSLQSVKAVNAKPVDALKYE